MTGQDMKQILESGGIRLTEAAIIFRVAQTTARRWFTGTTTHKQEVTYEIATKFTQMVEKAVAQGLLPVGEDIKGAARLPAIKAAIRSVAN